MSVILHVACICMQYIVKLSDFRPGLGAGYRLNLVA